MTFSQNVGQKILRIPSGLVDVRQFAVKAAAAFSPTDIAGCKLWIDFSDIDTLYKDSAKTDPVTNDGDVIGAAEDKSGEGNDVTQSTTAKKPLYKTGIKNSLSVGEGDGSDDWLATAGNVGLRTVYIVTAVPTGYAALAGVFGKTDSSPECVIRIHTAGSGIWRGIGTVGTDDFTYSGAFTLNDVATESFGVDTWNVLKAEASALKTYTWAVFSGRTDMRYWKKYIAEVVGYNVTLSVADDLLVETFLKDKWAVY